MFSMSRRQALARISAALGVAALGCGARTPVGDAEPSASRGHVVIVGAGMAGLAAAQALRSAGFAVEIVEARDRIGGRIRTDRTLGVPVDLGASWIHGARGNPITKLAKQHGIATASTDYDDVALYGADGEPVSGGARLELDLAWTALNAELGALGLTLDEDLSVQAAIDRLLHGETLTAQERQYLDWRLGTIEVTAAEDLDRLSFLAGDDLGFGGSDRLLPGGYDAVVRAVAQGTTVHLGHRVRRVRVVGERVHVEADARTWQADAALVTLPLGVMQAGLVDFEPGLSPAHRDALGALAMGTLNKVALRFPKPFWPTDRHFLGHLGARGEFPVFLNGARHGDAAVLVAFTGGSVARALESRSDREAVDRILPILRGIFGSVPDPEAAVMSRWSWNAVTRGSYSHIRPGGSADAFDALAEPVGERIFFAGEATIRSHPGTVHGAWLSGLREADRIARSITGAATEVGPAARGAFSPHAGVFPTTGPLPGCDACHGTRW